MDFALFKKPVLFVDFQEGNLPTVLVRNTELPSHRFGGFGLNHLVLLPQVLSIMAGRKDNRAAYNDPHLVAGGRGIPYVGGQCSFAELPEVLSNGDFTTIDQKAYDVVVEAFCYKNDGKSHERIADLVDRLPEKPRRTSAVTHFLKRVSKRLKRAYAKSSR